MRQGIPSATAPCFMLRVEHCPEVCAPLNAARQLVPAILATNSRSAAVASQSIHLSCELAGSGAIESRPPPLAFHSLLDARHYCQVSLAVDLPVSLVITSRGNAVAKTSFASPSCCAESFLALAGEGSPSATFHALASRLPFVLGNAAVCSPARVCSTTRRCRTDLRSSTSLREPGRPVQTLLRC